MPAPEKRGAEPFRIELRRIIARPVEEVYRAWTTPALIAKWFSPGIEEMQVSAEVRTGGPIRIELTYRGAPWRLDGKYLEVIPGKRLRFTWVTTECPAAIGSVVTVNFRDLGSRTELVLLHEGFPDRKTRDDHDATGWQQIVEVFVAAEGGALAPQRFADASRTVLAQARGDSYRVEVRKLIARPGGWAGASTSTCWVPTARCCPMTANTSRSILPAG